MSWRWRNGSAAVALLVAVLLPRGQPFVNSPCCSFRISSGNLASKRALPSRNVNMRAEEPSGQIGTSRAAFLRSALGGAAALATVVARPKETTAFALPFGPKDNPELEAVVKVAGYSRFVNKLEQDLKAGALKGGPEDSVVVLRVLEVYLEPMQEEMLKVAPLMQLAGRESRERVKLLPLIMKGHLLELKAACGTKDAKEQLEEVQEVRETLDEFIALAKTRYEIAPLDPEGAPDGDQLGIFGCSFYGMKRTDGSSRCQPDP
ncbi:unnamed protein product [Ectocarpus sp. 4 AP-2014]